MKAKRLVGQEMIVKEDFKINTIVSEQVKTVKAGDKGFLDSKGLLHITTGAGKGKIVKLNEVEMVGYDHENIADLIFTRLNNYFALEGLICIGLNDNDKIEKLLIIPSKYLMGIKQLSVGIKSKYDKFMDRWDYIEKYSVFYTSTI